MSQDPTTLSLTALAAAYRSGEYSPTRVTEVYLEKLEPGAVYRVVTAERAREQAARAEAQFRAGVDLGPLQGVPVALKDLLDTRGVVSAAGSVVLAEGEQAAEDCPAAARLDAAGAVFLGKTNMTELAFSGVGINPHFGTPGCADDPERIPGGSSSGSGVAVAKGLACAAVGSDTGGSVRIPAAFNGIVGLKTTDGAIPTDGCVPLSTTLDTLGPMTRTAEDAWHLWCALRAVPCSPFTPSSVRGLRVLAPTTLFQEGLEPDVANAFTGACELLVSLGVGLEHCELPIIREMPEAYAAYGSFASLESLTLYGEMLEREQSRIDPRVSRRILEHADRKATDYIRLVYARARIQREFWEAVSQTDVILAPTVPILPPRIAGLESDAAYFETNGQVLSHTMIFNFLGAPAVSVPCGRSETGLPIGLMIAARPHQEHLLLSVAAAVESALEDRDR